MRPRTCKVPEVVAKADFAARERLLSCAKAVATNVMRSDKLSSVFERTVMFATFYVTDEILPRCDAKLRTG